MKKIIFLFLPCLFLIHCSFRQVVVQATGDIVDEVQISFMTENDPDLAQQAFPGLIKIAEGMYNYYPKSPYYSGKLCFLWATYTFAYIDETPYSDYDEEKEMKEKKLLDGYNRAYRFGLKSLNRRIPDFEENILSNPEAALKNIKERDIETLFWFHFAWAMRIFNDTSDPILVLQLETVKKIADVIFTIKPDYLNYAIYAVYVAYYGGRNKAIGGDPEKGLKFYQDGLSLSKNKNSILDFVFLKFVSTGQVDDEKFSEIYEKIMAFDPNSDPDNIFIHKVIQKKAGQLYLRKEDLF